MDYGHLVRSRGSNFDCLESRGGKNETGGRRGRLDGIKIRRTDCHANDIGSEPYLT